MSAEPVQSHPHRFEWEVLEAFSVGGLNTDEISQRMREYGRRVSEAEVYNALHRARSLRSRGMI